MLRDEERARRERVEAGSCELRAQLLDPVPPGRDVEDELLLGEAGDVAEEREAIVDEMERAEDRRRRDGLRRRVGRQVAELERSAIAVAAARHVEHRLARVDSAVADATGGERRHRRAVGARQIEDRVAPLERRPERDDDLGAAAEIALRVAVLVLGEALGELVVLGAHSARSRSGCLRTKRRIPRQCQSVRRVKKRRSVTAACACSTIAAGTYHRSQPAFAAR